MEAANVVEPELVNGALEKASEASGFGLNTNKENEIIGFGSDALQSNDVLDPSELEGIVSSGVMEEATAAVPGNKVSNPTKNTKVMKDRGLRNGEAVISRNQRVALSKSLSFSAKVAPTSSLRKSTTFVKQKKTDAKDSGGSEVASSVTNGRLTPKQTDLAARTSTRLLLPVKSGSVDATVNGTFSKALQSNYGKQKPLRHVLPAKNDDDTHSTTSSTTPCSTTQQKSTGSGFAFRLDERAEKRKEFFMKIEEKIHAKEMEKTNLQEKSKENQEAEIKQLRKSLTFKATPMPSFYQEPGPAKVELKKTPPTRARSPKLGRRKASVDAAENSSESNASCRGPRPASDPSKLNGGATDSKMNPVVPKKPTQRSLSKPSQRSSAAKPKAANTKLGIEKSEVANNDKPTEDSLETAAAGVEIDSLKITTEGDATVLDKSDPGFSTNEALDPGICHDGFLVEY